MVKNIVRTSAAAVASIGLVAVFSGIAGASAGTITGTGPQSNNGVTSNNTTTVGVSNSNRLGLSSFNLQLGASGKAKVQDNTTAGDATSGDVTNSNSTAADVTITNGGGGSGWSADPSSDTGTISNTGPQSNNYVTSNTTTDLTVDNNNCVTIDNVNVQAGVSGSASVKDNTTGGNATSGSVSNSNSTSDTVTISN